jgi:colanic acid biosynthesis protein WcaH
MDVQDAYIPEAEFATCLRHMPQPCVDLIVEYDGGILVARRENEPASGEWFWPGGRLYKGERLDEAVHRVAREELSLDVELVERLGVSEHFWDRSSVAGVDSRHTIPIVYRVRPDPPGQAIDLDEQHSDSRVLRSRPEGDQLNEYVREYIDRFDLLQ